MTASIGKSAVGLVKTARGKVDDREKLENTLFGDDMVDKRFVAVINCG